MTKKKSKLGKGLGALLGDVKATTGDNQVAGAANQPTANKQASESNTPLANTSALKEMGIEQLQPGQFQPRQIIDKEALEELATSIAAQGILQPLLVRQLANNQYEIIAGERRWRAAQLAGLSSVPVIIREIADQTAMAVGLIENIQRQDLNAIETARGYQRLLEEFGLTHQEISESVGCSRASVSNMLRLTALHRKVQNMLENNQLDMGHARALLVIAAEQQPTVAQQVMMKKLSVRQTERLVKSLSRPKSADTDSVANEKDVDIRHLEEDLSQRINAKVNIRHSAKKGQLIIHYHSLDELDGILQRIR